MELYVAVYGYDYEGETILGVFDSKAKAQGAVEIFEESKGFGDYRKIYSYELNNSEYES